MNRSLNMFAIRAKCFEAVDLCKQEINIVVAKALDLGFCPHECAKVNRAVTTLLAGSTFPADWRALHQISKLDISGFQAEEGATVMDLLELHHELKDILSKFEPLESEKIDVSIIEDI